MASSVEQNDQVCINFASQLNALALNGQLKNDTQTVKTIEKTRKQLFPQNNDDEND